MTILSKQKVMIPRPKFFVFYHGKDTEPETLKLKLSDSFLGEPRDIGDFEWSATVLNLRPDEEVPLNKNCTPLYHYTKFISMITANIEAGMDNQKAVEKAVDEAIKEKIDLLNDLTKKWQAEKNIELSLSIGYAKACENVNKNIVELVNLADENMYKEKAEFYDEKKEDNKD